MPELCAACWKTWHSMAYFFVIYWYREMMRELRRGTSGALLRIREGIMTQSFLAWLRGLIAAGDVHPFYVTGEWRQLSTQVLQLDRHECQICKDRKRYRKADLVHHVNRVRRHPELALDIWYTDSNGERKRNLISVCKICHETVCHPERMRKTQKKPGFYTPERWD